MGAVHMNTDHCLALRRRVDCQKLIVQTDLGESRWPVVSPLSLSLQTEEMRKGDSLDLSPLSFYRQNIRWRNGTIVNRGSRSLLYFDRPSKIFYKFLYHRDYECKMSKLFQIPSLESQISMVGKVNYTRSGQPTFKDKRHYVKTYLV